MAFNPNEKMAALCEKRSQMEDLVTAITDIYDPEGFDESMGGLAMMLNNAFADLDKVVERMIHDHRGSSPYNA